MSNLPKINGEIYKPPLETKEEIQKRLAEKEALRAKRLLSQAMSHLQALKVYNEITKEKK